jgi:hypothetical protein
MRLEENFGAEIFPAIPGRKNLSDIAVEIPFGYSTTPTTMNHDPRTAGNASTTIKLATRIPFLYQYFTLSHRVRNRGDLIGRSRRHYDPRDADIALIQISPWRYVAPFDRRARRRK